MSKNNTCELEVKEAYAQLIKYAEDLHTTINLLKDSHLDLEMAYVDIVNRLAQAVEYKDEATGHHVLRICFFSAILAHSLGLSNEKVLRIYNSAAMHDVGKISIPDSILLKPGPLTTEEFEIMKTHTTVGAALLANSKSSLLETGHIIALNHHVRSTPAGGGHAQDVQPEVTTPAGFDTDDFLKGAKVVFNRLQQSWDSRDLDDIKQFTTPEKDDSSELYSMLMEAPALFISSPIYFYHLPSIFKTLIDRCQCFWFRQHNRDPFVLSLPPRKAYICLVAARPVGDQLFHGSLLTLKYFLSPFNISLAEPLLIYGKDGPDELANDPANK